MVWTVWSPAVRIIRTAGDHTVHTRTILISVRFGSIDKGHNDQKHKKNEKRNCMRLVAVCRHTTKCKRMINAGNDIVDSESKRNNSDYNCAVEHRRFAHKSSKSFRAKITFFFVPFRTGLL